MGVLSKLGKQVGGDVVVLDETFVGFADLLAELVVGATLLDLRVLERPSKVILLRLLARQVDDHQGQREYRSGGDDVGKSPSGSWVRRHLFAIDVLDSADSLVHLFGGHEEDRIGVVVTARL